MFPGLFGWLWWGSPAPPEVVCGLPEVSLPVTSGAATLGQPFSCGPITVEVC